MSQVTFDFSDCNFVVTGFSAGMGKQVAIELAAAGAKVLAIARGKTALEVLKDLYPENIEIGITDVCDAEILSNVITRFVAQYGKINGAVHAAGITALTPLKAFDTAEAQKIMDISFCVQYDHSVPEGDADIILNKNI